MHKRGNSGWLKHFDFILIDILCLELAFYLGFGIRFHWSESPYTQEAYRVMAVFWAVADIVAAAMFNTMHNVLKRGVGVEMLETMKHTLLIFSITTIFMFSVKTSEDYSRIVIYITTGLHLALSWIFRMLWKKVLRKRAKKGSPRSMLVVTSKASADKLLKNLHDTVDSTKAVSGLILTDGDSGKFSGVPVCADVKGATQYIMRHWVDEVFVDPYERSPEVVELVQECRKMGLTIHEAIALDNTIGNRQYLEKVGSYQVVTSSVNLATPLQLACKRVIDILAGLAGMAATGVILLFVAPKIKKASPGPVLFKQDRVGKNGRIFKFVKIRSMYLDAEERKKELMAQNRVADGMMFKMDFDPRIIGNKILPDGTKKTGIGQFIRNTSLDEFPQFWNVLKGDMSLVGTRPPTVDEWEKYDTHHRARLAMKPGITGLWQVSGRSEITDFEEVVRLDTEYIYNWSLLMDFKIIFKTIAVLFKKEGAM